jgi:O-acetylhomoserine (thiol)-lyase
MAWSTLKRLGVGSAFGANLSYIFKIRLTLLRDTGAAVSPFNAWLLALGLETLSLRIERHVENAKAVAAFLETHPQVEKVNYAGLASSPWHALARSTPHMVLARFSPLK